MYITINNQEYQLATTLRVAYEVQGMNNHQAYTKVFERIGDMTLEEQIGILYAAFRVGNPDQAKFVKQNDFLNSYLDTYTLSDLLAQLKELINYIMGNNPEVEVAQESDVKN